MSGRDEQVLILEVEALALRQNNRAFVKRCIFHTNSQILRNCPKLSEKAFILEAQVLILEVGAPPEALNKSNPPAPPPMELEPFA